ncbi:Transcriptional regulator, MarR family [hydrothermal vent metagenome]|uniref:Transcriptional regulator, MarR family n=1 Tax=hydrothermal vent metagenome TaxID=652676 RepID=A0A3B0SYX2_9ZZZZ
MANEPNPQGALHFWHHVALDTVRDADADLSARQLAILLTIYLQTPPHTVRGLAEKLGVTKPVITRALTTLGAMGLCARRRDVNDKRNVLIQRTVEGTLYLDRLAENLMRNAYRLTS